MNDYNARFTTEALEATLEDWGGIHPRQAIHLLKLDTVERRQRAYAEAMTQQNLFGDILSACLSRAVHALLESIANNTEQQELYGERTAREYREAEKKANDLRYENLKRQWRG